MEFIPGELYRIICRVRIYIYPEGILTWDTNTPCTGDMLLFLKYVSNKWEHCEELKNVKLFLYRDKLLLDSESTAFWPHEYFEHVKLSNI